MKAVHLLKEGEKRLAPSPDARWDARDLLEYALNIPHSAFLHALVSDVPEDAVQRYFDLVEKRKSGEPTQYILGKAWFMGLEYDVDARVLIPRQDTELLCEEALAFAKQHQAKSALDLCTGSGALAVALAALGGLTVTATDLSEGALAVAAHNAQKNHAEITFRKGDLLDALAENDRFDLIVCNPPYLTQQDMDELQAEVRREPAMALYGGDDGLIFYQRLAKGAKKHLNPGGTLLMEIGSEQGESVPALFAGWKTRVLKDLNGLDRVVEAIPE